MLVPALSGGHASHRTAFPVLRRVTVLPAHVLVETYSTLTRLPGPDRVPPTVATQLLDSLPAAVVTLPESEHRAMLQTLAAAGVGGGAVYDGLIAATALHHGVGLMTRDRRALRTYAVIGVDVEMLD